MGLGLFHIQLLKLLHFVKIVLPQILGPIFLGLHSQNESHGQQFVKCLWLRKKANYALQEDP
jgi:hypothetical protein